MVNRERTGGRSESSEMKSGRSDMGQDDVDGDGLAELRASLARFVLREAGHAAAEDPSLPLHGNMVSAMREEMQKAAEAYLAALPPAQKLAEAFIADIEPELLRIMTAGAEQPVRAKRGLGALLPSGRRARLGVVAAAAVVLATGGFLVGRWSAPAVPPPVSRDVAPEKTDVEVPLAAAPPGAALAEIKAANENVVTPPRETVPENTRPVGRNGSRGANVRTANAAGPSASQTTGDAGANAPAGVSSPPAEPAPGSEAN